MFHYGDCAMNRYSPLIALFIFLFSACAASTESNSPEASVLWTHAHTGGHYILNPDNSLDNYFQFKVQRISPAGKLSSEVGDISHPMILPDRFFLADRILIQGPEGYVASSLRDAYLEVWNIDSDIRGFRRIQEGYSPLPLVDSYKYLAGEFTVLLDDVVLTTAGLQELRAVGYDGRVRWDFMMGGPARLSVDKDSGRIYLTSIDGNLYALDSNGEFLWQRPNVGMLGVAVVNGIVIGQSEPQMLTGYGIDGETTWQLDLPAVATSLKAWQNIVIIACGNDFLFVDDSGSIVRRIDGGEVEADVVYVADDEWIFLLSRLFHPDMKIGNGSYNLEKASQRILCLDPDGNVAWQYNDFTRGYQLLPARSGLCYQFRFYDGSGNEEFIQAVGLR